VAPAGKPIKSEAVTRACGPVLVVVELPVSVLTAVITGGGGAVSTLARKASVPPAFEPWNGPAVGKLVEVVCPVT